jgi:hypothetical protein
MQAATKEPTTFKDNIPSRLRALRNRLQQPEEPTTSTVNTLSLLRALRNRF